MLHIRPECHPVGHILPLVLVLPHAFLALFDERLDAVLFDGGFAVQMEHFFHFQLHRQAMGIPPRLAQHILALHGLEPGDQVLDSAGFDMADMRPAVRRGRPVKEREALLPLVMVEGLFDDAVLLPEFQHLFFAPHEIHIRRNLLIHAFPLQQPFAVQKNRPVKTGRKFIRGTTLFGEAFYGNAHSFALYRERPRSPGKRRLRRGSCSGVICFRSPAARLAPPRVRLGWKNEAVPVIAMTIRLCGYGPIIPSAEKKVKGRQENIGQMLGDSLDT